MILLKVIFYKNFIHAFSCDIIIFIGGDLHETKP